MVVKETSHGPAVIGGQIIRDGQIINIRGGGSGGGMSPDGKAMCDLASSGVYPGWGVAGDLSQMRWPIGGIPGAYPQEKAEKEQD